MVMSFYGDVINMPMTLQIYFCPWGTVCSKLVYKLRTQMAHQTDN